MAILGLLTAAEPARSVETRCGWLANLTPQDLWLTDRQSTWTVTSQARALGPDARGLDKVPDFDRRQYVETRVGGRYGYGCACLNVVTTARTHHIRRVFGGAAQPLSKCRGDRKLGPPEGH